MAYDRYDSRRDERGGRWADDRERGHGRRDERGFFERASEEISSWFGDESSGGRDDGRGRDHRSEQDRGRERGDWFSSEHDRGRHSRGEEGRRPMSRSFGGPDRDDRSFGQDQGRWGDDGRDYRPMTGDYGRSEGRYGASGYRGETGRGQGFDRDFDRDRNFDRDRDFDRARDFDRDREFSRDRGPERTPSKWEQDDYRRTSFAGSTARSNHDDAGYHEARRRHMEEFDRDYDDYHRERQSSFENDFGGWREQRQSKRGLLGQIREHMKVVGNDDEHVGTVDRVAGDRIILTKSDPEAGGAHHSLTCTSIDRVEGDRVILDCSADQARKRWRDESRERALFEREDQGRAGPHVLDRSFSGTYR